jgi:hypothetical protein
MIPSNSFAALSGPLVSKPEYANIIQTIKLSAVFIFSLRSSDLDAPEVVHELESSIALGYEGESRRIFRVPVTVLVEKNEMGKGRRGGYFGQDARFVKGFLAIVLAPYKIQIRHRKHILHAPGRGRHYVFV